MAGGELDEGISIMTVAPEATEPDGQESERHQGSFSRNFNTMEKGKNNSTTNKNRSSFPQKFSSSKA